MLGLSLPSFSSSTSGAAFNERLLMEIASNTAIVTTQIGRHLVLESHVRDLRHDAVIVVLFEEAYAVIGPLRSGVDNKGLPISICVGWLRYVAP